MKFLKTAVSALLALTLALSLAACGETEPTPTPTPTPPAEEEFTYSSKIDDDGYWADVEAAPLVTLSPYSGVRVPRSVHAITDAAVQAQIDSILREFASSERVTDRVVIDGDTLNIDYVGKIDGVAFSGGSTGGQGADVTIGVTSYIDDFLDQLIGHKTGETFDITVTFPDNYHQTDLRGKDAVFTVTINYATVYTNPPLTDAFVKEKLFAEYGWETAAAMRAGVKQTLHNNAVSEYICDYLLENSTVSELPESLYWYQVQSMFASYNNYLSYYNVTLEEFVKNYLGFASTDAMTAAYESQNREAATFHLLVQAIAEERKISVSEDDIKAYFLENTGSADYAEIEEFYGLPYIKMMIIYTNVLDLLVAEAVLE